MQAQPGGSGLRPHLRLEQADAEAQVAAHSRDVEGRGLGLEALGHEVSGEHAPQAANARVGAPLEQCRHRSLVPVAHCQVQGCIAQGGRCIHKPDVQAWSCWALLQHPDSRSREMTGLGKS